MTNSHGIQNVFRHAKLRTKFGWCLLSCPFIGFIVFRPEGFSATIKGNQNIIGIYHVARAEEHIEKAIHAIGKNAIARSQMADSIKRPKQQA